ncbi:hypothetical protein Q9Q94_06935 [Uliginosibacterium sp. 31-16]|uniref:hypothetical protein n=1 Tax=Uliginosibacterium sp. 31-16 TaxID=3068315 RepID=UPI00273F96A5|nr:hypothetical protein [Uliginosibacterium sp. 31-16]MDP5239257.1 hypothetical protein [Uliginosibacterium sp. 31-16]
MMRLRTLTVVALFSLVSYVTPCFASKALAEKQPKRAAPTAAATTKPETKTTKPWEPTAFDESVDRLPPRYPGLDAIKFFEMLKSKLSRLKKGEFETSEEFFLRTEDKSAIFSPINTADLYAFKITDNYSKKYDADSQAYILEETGGLNCTETYSTSKYGNAVTCRITTAIHENDSYEASNAYGASVTVRRTRSHWLSVAINRDSSVFKEHFTKYKYLPNKHSFTDNIPVQLEKAKSLAQSKISMLFVGRLISPEIIEGRPLVLSATISSPSEIFATEDAIPFDLKKIVYFVTETGEILGQRSF